MYLALLGKDVKFFFSVIDWIFILFWIIWMSIHAHSFYSMQWNPS